MSRIVPLSVMGLYVVVTVCTVNADGPCITNADCADLNGDLIRDDNCVVWECEAATCSSTDIVYADMGGAFGECPADGTADGNDRIHALSCFTNVDPISGMPPYTCEDQPPSALNVDAGGRVGACAPDGVCDANDAYHALNAFGAVNTCTCSPAPIAPRRRATGGGARVFLTRDGEEAGAPTSGNTVIAMNPGETATVAVWLEDVIPGDSLNGYQLMLPDAATPLGGTMGAVTYVDDNPGAAGGGSVLVDTARLDWIFSGSIAVLGAAYNESPNLGAFGLFYGAGIPSDDVDPAGAGIMYLAEFEISTSNDAAGEFELALLRTADFPPRPLTDLFLPGGAEYAVAEYQPLRIQVGDLPCTTIADCADLDEDGVRDDGCVWWACDGGTCASTDVIFADMGGANGACPPDGQADNNDRSLALNCFSNLGCDGGGFECEDGPPAAYNVDAWGFSSCAPDGVCDGNDAFAALAAFANASTCTCPLDGSPSPEFIPDPVVAGGAKFTLRPSRSTIRPGGWLDVDVLVDTDITTLLGYQLHLGVSGGRQGHVELVDIWIRESDTVTRAQWSAFNVTIGQIVAGTDHGSIAVSGGDYLATFTYRVSEDAAGTFAVDVLHGEPVVSNRTFLFVDPPQSKVDISTAPAIITIDAEAESSAVRVATRRTQRRETDGGLRRAAGVGNGRVFMAEDGAENSAPLSGQTTVSMAAGETALIGVWVQDAIGGQLASAYQVLVPELATPQVGATGSVSYVDVPPAGQDSVLIDTGRPDWLFALSIAITQPTYQEEPGQQFGVIYNSAIPSDHVDLATPGDVPNPGGIHYVLQFELTASLDASGDHDLVFLPSTQIYNASSCEYDLGELQPLRITIEPGDCGDALCTADEDACNCPQDCGAPTANEVDLCNDGLDNDCDGFADCGDGDCVADVVCNVVVAQHPAEATDPLVGDPSFNDLDVPAALRGELQPTDSGTSDRAVAGRGDSDHRHHRHRVRGLMESTSNDLHASWSAVIKPGPASEGGSARYASGLDAYQLDDNLSDRSVQATTEVHLLWLVQHTVTPGNEILTDISVAWGAMATTPSDVHVVVYSDPNQDGNPADAVRLVQESVTIMNAGTNVLNSYPIPATTIGAPGTSFFFGAHVLAAVDDAPAAIDQTAPTYGRNWVAITPPPESGVGATLLEDVPASPNFDGNWMLRATAASAVCGNGMCEPGEPCDMTCLDCGPGTELPGANCTDGMDNDCDGDIDCADIDCATEPVCIPCTVTCEPGTLNEGEPLCGVDYQDLFNGGCNAADGTPDYQPGLDILTGAVCGEGGNYLVTNAACSTDAECVGSCNGVTCDDPQPFRDTDWYQFTLIEQREATFCVTAEFSVTIGLVDDGSGANCGAEVFEATAVGLPCQEVCATACLDAGTYSAFVATFPVQGLEACGSVYQADVTLDDCPPVSVCTNEAPGQCQLPDQAGHSASAAAPLTYVSTSDADAGSGNLVHASADNFRAVGNGTLTEVCWWGGYLGDSPLDCSTLEGPDDFTITYYEDDGGRPGDVLAGPLVPLTFDRMASGAQIGPAQVTISEFSYTATHDAVAIAAGQCYWIEIQNNTPAIPGCFWAWSTAPAGDNLSAQAKLLNPARPFDYRSGDERGYDLAWCVDDPAVEPGGCALTGACCDDDTATCNEGVALADCLFVDAGRPAIDQTCADVAATVLCGGGGCCLQDGSCVNTTSTDCATQGGFFREEFCAPDGLLVCPQPNTCLYDSGVADPNPPVASPVSQFEPNEYYAEAAGDFVFTGDGQSACPITLIRADFRHFDGSGTPDDYQSINVRIYEDEFAAASEIKTQSCTCAAPQPIPQGFAIGGVRNCANDAACLPSNCLDNNEDGDDECTAVSTITVAADPDLIVDLDVGLLIQHSWQGDLVVRLEHEVSPADIVSVFLMRRPGDVIHPGSLRAGGYPAANFGQPSTGTELLLDDDAPAPPINLYDAGGPGRTEFIGPARSGGGADVADVLSAFEGRTKEGIWRLYISDEFGVSGLGSLLDWTLYFNNAPGMPSRPAGNPIHTSQQEMCSGNTDCVEAGCGGVVSCVGGLCDAVTRNQPCMTLQPTGQHTGFFQACDVDPGNLVWQPHATPDAYELTLDLSECDPPLIAQHNQTYWLAIAPVVDPAADFFQTAHMVSSTRDGTAAVRVFQPRGVDPWQLVDDGLSDLAFTVEAGKIPPCQTNADCADLDGNNIRDDNCVLWECVNPPDGTCVGTAMTYADMGGQFGDCTLDGVADSNDFRHALNCFSDRDFSVPQQPGYPCDDVVDPMQVDAGGQFQTCCPDGACDGNDAFLALNSFSGVNPCECPLQGGVTFVCPCQDCLDDPKGPNCMDGVLCAPIGPAPEYDAIVAPTVVGQTAVTLVSSKKTARPGDRIEIDVYFDDAVQDLRGYQLHVGVDGGLRGSLDLIDMAIHERRDHVFAGLPDWRAFNVNTMQMVGGLYDPGIETQPRGYLVTYTYRVSADAQGTFVVDLRYDPRNPQHRTFLFPTPAGAKIDLTSTKPAVIKVDTRRASRR